MNYRIENRELYMYIYMFVVMSFSSVFDLLRYCVFNMNNLVNPFFKFSDPIPF